MGSPLQLSDLLGDHPASGSLDLADLLGPSNAPYDPLASMKPRPATAAEVAASKPIGPGIGIPRAPADVTQTPATSDRGPGTPITGVTGRILKNIVDPMLENPLTSAATTVALPAAFAASPVLGLLAGGAAIKPVVENAGEYAGQKAAELTLPPDVRAMAEADPTRIQGADVATQLAALAAFPLLHAGYKAVVPDIGAAVPDAFRALANEARGTMPLDDEMANAVFAQGMEMSRAAAATEEAKTAEARPVLDLADLLAQQPTAQEAKAIAKTPPPPGFETNAGAVEDIASQGVADQVAAQAKAEADAAEAQAANEAQAKADYEATLGSRTPLGVETGVVRRPGAGVPTEPEAPTTTEAPVAPGAPAESVTSASPEAPVREPTPAYPAGFAMGEAEGRIPEIAPVTTPRGNPPVPGAIVTHDLADLLAGEPVPLKVQRFGEHPNPFQADATPVGAPKNVPPEQLVNRSAFAQRQQTALDQAVQAASAQGLDKSAVPFAQQAKVAQAFADAVGLDRLQLDPKAFSRLSGAEIVGLKNVLSRNLDLIDAYSQQLAKGGLNVEEADGLGQAIDRLRAQNETALQGIVRGSEQAGRDLGFLRTMAAHTLDPDTWVVTAQRLAGDVKLSDATLADIRRIAKEAAEICGA